MFGGHLMVCPPPAGVARFSGPGVDFVILGFPSSPCAPPKGDTWRYGAHYFLDTGRRYDDIVHRWRGWPASAGRGWTCYFVFPILPLRPLQRGTFNGVSTAGGGGPKDKGQRQKAKG
jgi:hypothetical protein